VNIVSDMELVGIYSWSGHALLDKKNLPGQEDF
jgi:hypothetical protein